MAPPAPLPDPPRGYDPAPSRNAFLTVMGVFAFFGVCFLVVALWIRCVAGVESHYERRRRGSRSSGGGGPRFGPRRLSRSGSSSRKRRGFQEWYHRRGNGTVPPAPPAPPPPLLPQLPPPPTPQTPPTPNRRTQPAAAAAAPSPRLLSAGSEGDRLLGSAVTSATASIYSTFGRGSRSIPRTPGHHKYWYRPSGAGSSPSPSSSPSTSSPSPPPNPPKPPPKRLERPPTKTRRIPARSASTPSAAGAAGPAARANVQRLSGSPSRRGGDASSPNRRGGMDALKRAWTMPITSAGSKVSKHSHHHPHHHQSQRLYGGGGGGGGAGGRGRIHARRKGSSSSSGGGRARAGGFAYNSRGLDVVFEEAGTTPER